jgi:hypothetical protein
MNSTTPAYARDLTDWFTAEVKPVHVGVYECQSFDARKSAFQGIWNGEHWCLFEFPHMPFKHQRRLWRGLAKEPA